jgi:hypothetical protein
MERHNASPFKFKNLYIILILGGMKMKSINNNIYQFASIDELINYTNKKYTSNANYISPSIHIPDNDSIKLLSISFNNFIRLSNGLYISIVDYEISSDEKIVIYDVLNKSKKNYMDGMGAYSDDSSHIMLTIDKYVNNVELVVFVINKTIYPGWMDIVYKLTELNEMELS